MSDEIIRELWRIKDSIAEEHGYDVKALVTHHQNRQQVEGRRVVDLGATKRYAKGNSDASSSSQPSPSMEPRAMGSVHVNVGLSNPSEPGRAEEVRVLVDTGATLSVLPSDLLDNMGIQRTGQRRLRGFCGVITRDTGTVNIAYDGEIAGVTAVFGEDSDPTVMGVTALESLGFNVNPVVGELTRVEMLI